MDIEKAKALLTEMLPIFNAGAFAPGYAAVWAPRVKAVLDSYVPAADPAAAMMASDAFDERQDVLDTREKALDAREEALLARETAVQEVQEQVDLHQLAKSDKAK